MGMELLDGPWELTRQAPTVAVTLKTVIQRHGIDVIKRLRPSLSVDVFESMVDIDRRSSLHLLGLEFVFEDVV